MAAAEEHLQNANLELQIATEAAQESAQARTRPGAAIPAKKTVKTGKKSNAPAAQRLTGDTAKDTIKDKAEKKKTAKKAATGAPSKAESEPAKAPVQNTKAVPAKTAKSESPAAEPLPKPRPVDPEPMGTAVTVPPAHESSLLPEHGFTTLIEPRDNPLPKPQPI